jgi:NitT/TauT family transport system substrate-binding protein
MVRATLRGLREAIDDPAAAFQISMKYVEGLDQLSPEEQALQRDVLDASVAYWEASPLGFSDPQAWDNMQSVLLEMGLLTDQQDLSAAFTNEYLP